MRIGLDLSVLGSKPWTGIAKYSWNLARALVKLNTSHEFIFFVCPSEVRFGQTKESEEGIAALHSLAHRQNFSVVELPPKKFPIWTAHIQYARIMKRTKLDVLHGTANSIPLFYRDPAVITIHDLAIYLHPEWFPTGQWLATEVVVPYSIKKARFIISPSLVTKQDLVAKFGVREERIRVIPLGVGEEFFISETSKIEGQNKGVRAKKYFLSVGTLEPRKNIARLVEAYESLPNGLRDEYDLLIAGSLSKVTRKIIERPGVKLLGYVPDEALPSLYQGATIFIYPSLYEGFGLPVLEALAAGVPVITSKGTAMGEIVGTNAVLVNPNSVEAIAQAIRDIANLSQKVLSHSYSVKHFTWKKTAKETLRVYEEFGGRN